MTPNSMQPTMSELVMAVAFAIEDPCGEEAIHLARALIELGRAVPECRRKALTSVLTQLPYLLCHDLGLTYKQAQDRIDHGLPVEVNDHFGRGWEPMVFKASKPARSYRVPPKSHG